MTLLLIMILSHGREPWRLVEHQCGTNLVPLQGIILKAKYAKHMAFTSEMQSIFEVTRIGVKVC